MRLHELDDWYKQGGEMLVDDLLRERGWSWASLGHNRKLELYEEAQKEVVVLKKPPPLAYLQGTGPGQAKCFDKSWMTEEDYRRTIVAVDKVIEEHYSRGDSHADRSTH